MSQYGAIERLALEAARTHAAAAAARDRRVMAARALDKACSHERIAREEFDAAWTALDEATNL